MKATQPTGKVMIGEAVKAGKVSSQPGVDMQNKEQERLRGGSAVFLPSLTLVWWLPVSSGGMCTAA